MSIEPLQTDEALDVSPLNGNTQGVRTPTGNRRECPMTRRRIGTALTAAAAISFVVTAGIHITGYDSVSALAREGPADLASLVPALWLVFAFDLVIIGLIVGVVAIGGATGGRLIMVLAALCPLGAAGLQICFLGFIPPTAILVTVAALTLMAAGMRPARGKNAQHS